jgi:hypothetical protein
MDQDRLGQGPIDRVARVQGAIGVLEHHLHLAAERLGALAAERLVIQHDASLPVRHQPRERFQHRGFARARLANQAERLARSDPERHVPHRLELAEADIQAFDLDHDLLALPRSRKAPASSGQAGRQRVGAVPRRAALRHGNGGRTSS